MSIGLKQFIYLLGCFVVSFLFCLGLIKIILSKKTRGQVEREFTLDSHIKKDGTPNMGGIGIVSSVIFCSLIFGVNLFKDIKSIILILVFFLFFFIGFLDDFLKIKFNSYEGLPASLRFVLEIAIVLLCISLIGIRVSKFSFIEIKILDLIIPLGIMLVPLIIFIVVGISNSVNLSDGLDGLASGMMMFSILPFTVIALSNQEYNIAIILISALGSISAFLVFNIHPAKIFMGDCGALSLGALISFSAILLKEYFTLIISCSFFIFETLSVIIQVVYYKKTKKRIFLMAPFHHHLEKKGQPEWRIVMGCWLFGLITSFICILMEVL